MIGRTLTLGAAALIVLAGSFGAARAEMIELSNGGVMHGQVLEGQSTDDALALELFETGGVVMVRWGHVEKAGKKGLREELGIHIPEEEQFLVDGHRVAVSAGGQKTVYKRGVAENPDARGSGNGLRLKTRTGIVTIPWETVGSVDEIDLEGLVAYSRDELYQMALDRAPPETARAHFDLAVDCQRFGDFEHAKEHFETAATDAEFVQTGDGRSIAQRVKNLDILIQARGAQDMIDMIKRQMATRKWNDALATLTELDEQYQDDAIRKAVRFDSYTSKVLKGRDKYFRKRVALQVYKTMRKSLMSKAREKKAKTTQNLERGQLPQGTIASAQRWASRDLGKELWNDVGSSLGIEAEEMERFWKERSIKGVQTASYGTGSFIVIKSAEKPKKNDRRQRRRPSSRNRGGNKGNQPEKQVAKKLTDEEWWQKVRDGDKAKWLEAYFVENSGVFEIIRTDESTKCSNCGGKGVITQSSTSGGDDSSFCPQCNGAGKSRKVVYR